MIAAKLSAKTTTPTQIQEQTQYLDFCWLWWALGQPLIRQIESHFYQGSCLSGSLGKISITSHAFKGKPPSLAGPTGRSLSWESGAPSRGQGEAVGHRGTAGTHVHTCHGGALLQMPHLPMSDLPTSPIWQTGYAGGLEMGTGPDVKERLLRLPHYLFRHLQNHKNTYTRSNVGETFSPDQYNYCIHMDILYCSTCQLLCVYFSF